MNRSDALLLIVALVVIAAAVVAVIAWRSRPSKPPAAWWIRGLAGAAGTLLLVLAVLNPDPIAEAGNRLFSGPPGPLAAEDAVTLARLLLVLAALGFLLVPGTWMDVAAGALVALAVAGFIGSYKDTHAILACPKEPVAPKATPDPKKKVNKARQCPTPAPPGPSTSGVDIAIALPKDKVVAPLREIKSKLAVMRPVVEIRGDEGLLRTETHKYRVGLVDTVPAEELADDVIVTVDTRKSAEELLSDVTAAKTIYLTPY